MTYRASPADGVAWVTGASSGIGLSVCIELCRRGYLVAATARNSDELDRLAATVSSMDVPGKGRVIPFPADVTDKERMAAIAREIEVSHGPIALAFFNAGIAPYVRAGELDIDAFKSAFNVNVMGVVNGLAPVLKLMSVRRKGQVAVTASVAGYRGLPRAAAYGASKAAAIHLCEALKFDCDNLGVTIQVVNPGFVETPLTAKNDFPMPTAIAADVAARRICDGFERAGFEIAFPRRLSWLLKFLRAAPYALYFPAVARATGWKT